MLEKLKETLKKLINIKDKPHTIAFGFSLGVFLGLLPGTGSMVAIAAAFIFKANKAAAFAGSISTNTWSNFILFPLATGIGTFTTGIKTSSLAPQFSALLKKFNWCDLFSVILTKAFLALFLGYVIVDLLLAGAAYAAVYLVIRKYRKKDV